MQNDARMLAVMRSLDGLSVGDAFGECFFSISLDDHTLAHYLSTRTLPNWKWCWTDDTAMALSVVELLLSEGTIRQDELAAKFAARYSEDHRRGYGGTAHGILRAIAAGEHWRPVSLRAFNGAGSMGNGGAMRVAPLGAHFAHDIPLLIEQARLSAEVTHAHAEGQAGAIAVALAAAYVARIGAGPQDDFSWGFFEFLIKHVPDGETRAGIIQASELPVDYSPETAASVLGNGSRLTAPDTVPFCLWCAARSPHQFEEALWTTVSCGGDMDTNCAIVGGVVASNPHVQIPADWLRIREPLPF